MANRSPSSTTNNPAGMRRGDAKHFCKFLVGMIRRYLTQALHVSVGEFRSPASVDILPVRDRLKMVRVYTSRNRADVVEGHAFRDRSSKHLVHGTVGKCLSLVARGHAIPVSVDLLLPNPAARGWVNRVLDGTLGAVVARKITKMPALHYAVSTTGAGKLLRLVATGT